MIEAIILLLAVIGTAALAFLGLMVAFMIFNDEPKDWRP